MTGARRSVTIHRIEKPSIVYTDVDMVSVGEKWIFVNFMDGHRAQVPCSVVEEIIEEADVFVKGIKNDIGLSKGRKNDVGKSVCTD